MKKIESAPVPFSIITKLPEKIGKLVFDTEFNDIVNHVNEKYYYWDKIKYLEFPGKISPEQIWAVAKLRRMTSPYKVQLAGQDFTWFLNGTIQSYLHFFDMNIGGSLETRSLIPKDDKNRYLVSSIMEEAIASSQIEGAVTTRKAAKEMLRKNRAPRNKSEHMIMNNYITIQKILEIKDENLTSENLLEIHKLISSNTLDNSDYEGKYRDTNDINVVDVQDDEVVYSPPDYKEIKKYIDELCLFFNEDEKTTFFHPIIKGCIVHFMIGFIHPFVDGNGRTARALFYWYLLKKGYWLTEYLSISKLILKSKTQYARAFLYTETDDNDLTYFISYKLKTMKLAYNSLREYIERKLIEKKQIAEFIKIDRINDRQALILKWIYEEPSLMLTVKEVENRLSISNQTARTDLQNLVNLDFLNVVSLNLKKEAYIKSENFDSKIKTHSKRGTQKSLFDR